MSLDIVYDPHDLMQVLPDRLYKFRKWKSDNHKDVLKKQALFMPTPQQLWDYGDADDCRFPIEFPSTYDEYMDIITAMGDKPTWKNHTAEEVAKFKRNLVLHRLTSEGRAQIEREYLHSQNSVQTVLSLTGRHDNIKMWQSSYCDFEHGFCIGFEPSYCATDFFNKRITGGPCNYVPDTQPPIPYKSYSLHGSEVSIQMTFEHIFMKKDRFSFEEEYRLVRRFYPNEYPKGFTPDDQLLTIPKNAFREITVGHQMSPADIDEIIEVCKEQQLHVKIYMAFPDGANVKTIFIEQT